MATNVKRKKKAEVMADDGNMTLTGHLKELRNRLIVCAVVFVVAVVVTLSYADRLIDLLTAMGQGFYTFVSIAPQEKLMQYFRVSLLAAVVVTVPVALYQVYAFAKPGLKKSETFFLKLVILLGLALFVVGVLFAYKLMMPFMLRFLSTGIGKTSKEEAAKAEQPEEVTELEVEELPEEAPAEAPAAETAEQPVKAEEKADAPAAAAPVAEEAAPAAEAAPAEEAKA